MTMLAVPKPFIEKANEMIYGNTVFETKLRRATLTGCVAVMLVSAFAKLGDADCARYSSESNNADEAMTTNTAIDASDEPP